MSRVRTFVKKVESAIAGGDKTAYDGEHPPGLLLGTDPVCTGTGGLATDVDDVGTVVHQRHAVGDRGLRVEELAAVGEGVGRDVDDAHDQATVLSRQMGRQPTEVRR